MKRYLVLAIVFMLIGCEGGYTPTPEPIIPQCPDKAHQVFSYDYSLEYWLKSHPEVRSIDVVQLGKNGNKGLLVSYCQ